MLAAVVPELVVRSQELRVLLPLAVHAFDGGAVRLGLLGTLPLEVLPVELPDHDEGVSIVVAGLEGALLQDLLVRRQLRGLRLGRYREFRLHSWRLHHLGRLLFYHG